jgi:DNA-directed RNA polymerase subunit N (RpoN/RPB10)
MVTNLPRSWSVRAVWRRYNGRAESENRIKELGSQFGIKGFCCQKFAATQAVCQLAIWAYNLCVLLQRELGLLEKVQLLTLRWRLFCRAGVWSRAQGKATLKLAVAGNDQRQWWIKLMEKLKSSLPTLNCNAVELSAT